MEGSITVLASYDRSTSYLKISVKDTGIGISPENRKKLFVLFGKLQEAAHINTSGIGLGLNICKRIVEAFDGQIYIEDNEDGVV